MIQPNPHRLIFMGTPDFSVPVLRALHGAGDAHNWRVVAVVTQPDRPVGRKRVPQPPPVKQFALEQSIPVLQTETLLKKDRPINPTVAELQALTPDAIVVAAYGLILPRSVLRIPPRGCINVHASLLPAYRGASPITAALLDGLSETGTSIMRMDAGLDTGPVIAQSALAIANDDTTASLTERMAQHGADLLLQTLPPWLNGAIEPIDQADLPGEVSEVGLISKEDGRIDWRLPAVQIERMTRAYTPWPSAFTAWQGQTYKIWRAEAIAGEAEPGRVVEREAGVAVGTGEGLLWLIEVQPAGKRPMDVQAFLNGAPDFVGARLGD